MHEVPLCHVPVVMNEGQKSPAQLNRQILPCLFGHRIEPDFAEFTVSVGKIEAAIEHEQGEGTTVMQDID